MAKRRGYNTNKQTIKPTAVVVWRVNHFARMYLLSNCLQTPTLSVRVLGNAACILSNIIANSIPWQVRPYPVLFCLPCTLTSLRFNL